MKKKSTGTSELQEMDWTDEADNVVLQKRPRRRSIRLRRQSHGKVLEADSDLPVQDVCLLAQSENEPCNVVDAVEIVNTKDENFGSVWMASVSPHDFLTRRRRRKSCRLPDISTIDISNDLTNDFAPGVDNARLDMEIYRTKDARQDNNFSTEGHRRLQELVDNLHESETPQQEVESCVDLPNTALLPCNSLNMTPKHSLDDTSPETKLTEPCVKNMQKTSMSSCKSKLGYDEGASSPPVLASLDSPHVNYYSNDIDSNISLAATDDRESSASMSPCYESLHIPPVTSPPSNTVPSCQDDSPINHVFSPTQVLTSPVSTASSCDIDTSKTLTPSIRSVRSSAESTPYSQARPSRLSSCYIPYSPTQPVGTPYISHLNFESPVTSSGSGSVYNTPVTTPWKDDSEGEKTAEDKLIDDAVDVWYTCSKVKPVSSDQDVSSDKDNLSKPVRRGIIQTLSPKRSHDSDLPEFLPLTLDADCQGQKKDLSAPASNDVDIASLQMSQNTEEHINSKQIETKHAIGSYKENISVQESVDHLRSCDIFNASLQFENKTKHEQPRKGRRSMGALLKVVSKEINFENSSTSSVMVDIIKQDIIPNLLVLDHKINSDIILPVYHDQVDPIDKTSVDQTLKKKRGCSRKSIGSVTKKQSSNNEDVSENSALCINNYLMDSKEHTALQQQVCIPDLKVQCRAEESRLPVTLPDVTAADQAPHKKRGRRRKSMSKVQVSSETTGNKEIVNNTNDNLQCRNEDLQGKQDTLNFDNLNVELSKNSPAKMLTNEQLKDLDMYLGIDEKETNSCSRIKIDDESKIQKKRGRPRKSIDGKGSVKDGIGEWSKKCKSEDVVIATENVEAGTVLKAGDDRTNSTSEADASKDDNLEALMESVERCSRRSSTRLRRSTEIYRKNYTENLLEEADKNESKGQTTERVEPLLQEKKIITNTETENVTKPQPKPKLKRKRKTEPEVSVEDLYRNKNYKPPEDKMWETIYESPSELKNTDQLFGKKRLRRSICFETIAPAKIKKRLQKAVKMGCDPRKRKKKTLSHDAVLSKIAQMEEILQDI